MTPAAPLVGLIDYGMGNLRSVQNALEKLEAQVFIAHTPAELERADRVILPGVGAFGDAMANLSRNGWLPAMAKVALDDQKPFLGICLGMQLLAERGTEYGDHRGLGWLKGSVKKLERPEGTRIPHMGWNEVRALKTTGLLQEFTPQATCYFVHSYAFVPDDPSIVSGVTDYAGDFVSVVEHENIVGAQFHPEKSQRFGLALLKRFLEM